MQNHPSPLRTVAHRGEPTRSTASPWRPRHTLRALSALFVFGLLSVSSPAVVHAGKSKGCSKDSDCKDGNPGTFDWCEEGQCFNVDRDGDACRQGPDSCDSTDDCKDGNGDTVEWCEQGRCYRANRASGTCPALCTKDDHCKDGDSSTIDWCEEGQCYNLEREDSSCLAGPDHCSSSSDCKDGDSSTIDWCEDGRCYSAARDGAVCNPTGCHRDDDCRDGLSDTVDWCADGRCHHAGRGDATCIERESACKKDSHCRDGDSGTVDWCHEQQCYHATRADGSCTPSGGFHVVEYEYMGACQSPFLEPTISIDGTSIDVPFEGSGFEVTADVELGIEDATEDCFLLVTIALPQGRQMMPAYIDVVGEVDLDSGAHGTLNADYRLIGGGASQTATTTLHGPFTGGIRAQSAYSSPDEAQTPSWSECGQRLATFRISTKLLVGTGTGEFAELNLTNAIAGNRCSVRCGYSVRRCW